MYGHELLTHFLRDRAGCHLYSDWKVHTTWGGLLAEEKFQQGDVEKLKGMPVSLMADRTGIGLSAVQVRQ